MTTKRQVRKRRSESEWRAIVERFEKGGLPAAVFSRQAGIDRKRLAFWRWKLQRSSSADSAGLAEFVEMKPSTVPLVRPSDVGPLPFSRTFRWTIDVIFPDGTSARMGG